MALEPRVVKAGGCLRARLETLRLPGALLLTPRELFLRLGLFDERYAPAYYEDTDYCMALRADGYRVVYQPAAVIIHHEFGSAPRRGNAIAAQLRNRRIFVDKWTPALSAQMPPSLDGVLLARDASRRSRLLFVDAAIVASCTSTRQGVSARP